MDSAADQFPLCRLSLQVCLHLHVHLLPFCLVSQIACFVLKFARLHPTYRVVLLALHLISVLIQICRPILGYYGNLEERIPALSGFWILTALLHLPAQLFLGINPEIFPLPMERYTILVDTILSTVELISSTLLIRLLAQQQMERFRLALAVQQQKVDFVKGDGEKEGGRQ